MFPCLNSCAGRSIGKGDLKFCLKPLFANPEESILFSSASTRAVDSMSQTGLPQAITQHRTALQTHQTSVHFSEHSWAAALKHHPPMPPGQQLTQAWTALRPGREQEQFQLSGWIGQHSQVLWLPQFFKTLQPLGTTLCWNKIITDFKERVTSVVGREGVNIWKGSTKSVIKMQSSVWCGI